jgi:DNA repair exonuclease SbcCD ATPase subunit
VTAREAQLGGKAGAREAIKHQRAALEKLVRAARDELGGKPTEAVTSKIRQTLEAAAVDDQAAEDVRRGRLAKELEPAGFGTLAAHAPAPGKKPARPARDATAAKEALAEARARLREAEDELRGAQAEERQAHKRWQQAQGDAEEAEKRVEKIRRELEQLRGR